MCDFYTFFFLPFPSHRWWCTLNACLQEHYTTVEDICIHLRHLQHYVSLNTLLCQVHARICSSHSYHIDLCVMHHINTCISCILDTSSSHLSTMLSTRLHPAVTSFWDMRDIESFSMSGTDFADVSRIGYALPILFDRQDFVQYQYHKPCFQQAVHLSTFW